MAPANLLQRGDFVPHIVLSRPDGSLWDYAVTTWQRKNLLLVCLAEEQRTGNRAYVEELLKLGANLVPFETTWVLTMEAVAGMPQPGVLIADKWGEVYCVAGAANVAELPNASAILEWLRYIEHECPECQGEAK